VSNTLYGLYVSDVIKLAKTLVVKSVATADAINKDLMERNVAVGDDPTTWRYYKNISGSYHSTDTMMTVTSLDSQTTINFTQATLQDNRATRKAYAYGTDNFVELVKRYPTQELLIRGILNPVNIQTAIAAPDNTILNYEPDLVEPTEVNLIPMLQAWTNAYFSRWATPAYDEVDDLYRAAIFGNYNAQLPGIIETLRLENCKTEFAHSYHIWEYLESNGHLGEYREFFSTKQALWLYRNVKYLQMNAGRVSNQNLLIDNVMSDRGLPVAAYKMIHDITNFETGESLYPDIALARVSRNARDKLTGGKTTHTVMNMLTRESKLARDNLADIDLDTVTITDQMQVSGNNTLPTKILESSVIDSSASDVFPLTEIALNEWLHKATHGYYQAKIQVTNPFTGALMSMTAVEAFVVWLYATNRTFGLTLDTIPDVTANRFRLTPLPSIYDLQELVLPEYVSDNELQWILESNADVGTMLSTEAFLDTITAIHTAATNQYFMYTMHENFIARGQCEAAVMRCYGTVGCVLDPNHSSFEDYFKARGWYVVELDDIDSATLSADILKYATGQDLTNVKSLGQIQGAMIKFMSQMSSYSTQWIQTINATQVKAINAEYIRMGDDRTRLRMSEEIPLPGPEVLQADMLLKASEAVDLVADVTNLSAWLTFKNHVQVDVVPDMRVTHAGYAYTPIRNPTPGVMFRQNNLTERLTVTELNGLEFYLIDPLPGDDPQLIPLGQVILVRGLNGLYYPDPFPQTTANRTGG
jgi:hypothetical protein